MFKFNPRADNDAWRTIRGFVYQVEITIERWLNLDPNDQLELEAGEDIDLVVPDLYEYKRRLEQVKSKNRRVTLRSRSVLESIVNFHAHLIRNPDLNLTFRFVTNAGIAKESRLPRPFPIPLLTAWNHIASDSVEPGIGLGASVASIRACLESYDTAEPNAASKAVRKFSLSPEFSSFVSTATLEGLTHFIKKMEWATSQLEPENIQDVLKRTIAKRWGVDDSKATIIYQNLFYAVFKLLTTPGKKILAYADIEAILVQCQEAPEGAFSRLISQLANLDSRLKGVEDDHADLDRKIKILEVKVDQKIRLIESGLYRPERIRSGDGRPWADSLHTATHGKQSDEPHIISLLESVSAENRPLPGYVLEALFPDNGLLLGPGGECALWWLAARGFYARLTKICEYIYSQAKEPQPRSPERFRGVIWSILLTSYADSQRGLLRRATTSLRAIWPQVRRRVPSEALAWHFNVRSIIAGKMSHEQVATSLAERAILMAEMVGDYWLSITVRLRMLHRNDWHESEQGIRVNDGYFESLIAESQRGIKYVNVTARLHLEALKSATQVLHYSWRPEDFQRTLDQAQNTISLLSYLPDESERSRMISESARVKLHVINDPVAAIVGLREGLTILVKTGNLARLRYYLLWLAEAFVRTDDLPHAMVCIWAAKAIHNKLYGNVTTDMNLVERLESLYNDLIKKTTGVLRRPTFQLYDELAECTGIDATWWNGVLE